MTTEANQCKIWSRFKQTKKDGSVVKFRIQDLPESRMDDFMNFITTHFIRDESVHKAAGVAKSKEAIEDYKKLTARMYELSPPLIAICCLDTDSVDFDEILAVSTVQLSSNKMSLEDYINEIKGLTTCKEILSIFQITSALYPKFPQSLKEKYEWYYDGRGIVVHPAYRGLGIASQLVKQRRMLCKENNVPMTCAWMTSVGSQKAAEKDSWETVAEITLEELNKQTGLDFGNDVPCYKLMIATTD